MEPANWFTGHWADLFQTIGIIASFLVAAYTAWKDEKARRVSNSIAINGQYGEIWNEMFRYPKLARAFDRNADLEDEPVSIEEETLVKRLIAHLSTVYGAMKHGEFVTLDGLQKDIQGFFALPIPKAVWEKFKSLQDRKFAVFVDNSLRPDSSNHQ